MGAPLGQAAHLPYSPVRMDRKFSSAGERALLFLCTTATGRASCTSLNFTLARLPSLTSGTMVTSGTIATPVPISTARLTVSMLSNSTTG